MNELRGNIDVIHRDKLAKELRDMADQIERGEISVNGYSALITNMPKEPFINSLSLDLSNSRCKIKFEMGAAGAELVSFK